MDGLKVGIWWFPTLEVLFGLRGGEFCMRRVVAY